MTLPVDTVKYIRIESPIVYAYDLEDIDGEVVHLPKGAHLPVTRILVTEPAENGAVHRLYMIKFTGSNQEFAVFTNWWNIVELSELPPAPPKTNPAEFRGNSTYKLVRDS